MKEINDIIEKIDLLKKQFEKNKKKINELDKKIQEIDLNSNNTTIIENIAGNIINLKSINQNIDETILELERKLEILSRYQLEHI
ncbi:MAG: hypothetical protein ACTSVY_01535 [Candidatus Helarchaeota archaeon]